MGRGVGGERFVNTKMSIIINLPDRTLPLYQILSGRFLVPETVEEFLVLSWTVLLLMLKFFPDFNRRFL